MTEDGLIWDPTHGRAGEGTGGEGGNQTNAAERTGEDKAYAKHRFLSANVFFPSVSLSPVLDDCSLYAS